MSNDELSGDDTPLSETMAYIALRRLQRRYADIVTRRAWPELHEIMRPDCVVTVDIRDRGSLDFDGPRAIGDFIGEQIRQFDLFQFVVLNTVMDIDAATGTATARMYMQEIRQNVGDGHRNDIYGVYHDRFERDGDGRWWFARRRYASWARTNPRGSATDMTVFDLPEIPLDEL